MNQDEFVCSKPDCTFAITGTCLESTNDPTHNCLHLKKVEVLSLSPSEGDSGEGFEEADDSVRQFSSSLELGLQDAARLMQSKYVRLVGILGQVEAGKTCLFTSLYLQLTGRHLCPKYRFVASDTLLGFEQRARHLRDWSQGRIPDQIVDHTRLGHSRSPAFLHLAIQDAQGVRHDLLLPDLPGEWTTRLLSDTSTVERFSFLSRSDIVVIVLDAPTFAHLRTRNNAIADATHLLARLADDIQLPKSIPILLAVTKCDETEGQIPSDLIRVADVATGHGYSVTTVALAAFPTHSAKLPTGFGIDILLSHLTSDCLRIEKSVTTRFDGEDRSYLKARGQ